MTLVQYIFFLWLTSLTAQDDGENDSLWIVVNSDDIGANVCLVVLVVGDDESAALGSWQ